MQMNNYLLTYSAARTDACGKSIIIINYVLLLARFHLSIRIGQKKPTHTLLWWDQLFIHSRRFTSCY